MTRTTAAIGIDFGTTNSAVAMATGDGPARVLPLPGPGDQPVGHWRTVLCFEPAVDGAAMRTTAGPAAISRYARSEGVARLLQSIKSHLASASFVDTHIFGRRFRVEELVATYLRAMREAAPVDLGRRVVIGRPVRYWGADGPADDARAVARMAAALELAGFDEVRFALEPVAAAHAYAARLDHDELVLIADFGGGTSDFSLVAVGPRSLPDVRATSGVGLAGDAFDARVVDHAVSPSLGKGTSYRAELGGRTPVPAWLFNHLRRWHHLSMLRSPDTLALLDRIAHGAEDPIGIGRLVRLVDDDLGLPLHDAVEAAKVALSSDGHTRLRFARPGIAIEAAIDRPGFDGWIAEELAAIDGAVAEVLGAAGAADGDVDRVFVTGGSSLVPAVRAVLAARFGADRLVGGEELTSVAAGLAEMALS